MFNLIERDEDTSVWEARGYRVSVIKSGNKKNKLRYGSLLRPRRRYESRGSFVGTARRRDVESGGLRQGFRDRKDKSPRRG